MKILGVDDKINNLCLLEAMLRGAGWGYEVVSAHNGVEALHLLEQDSFDLIISDILMPQMDGFELCHQVKQRADLRRIPFIFYTATYTEKKDQELGLRLGASRFIIKPLDPNDFLAVIREVIQQYEAGQLVSAPPPVEKEEVLLKAYNRRLVHKLDKKVQEAEQASQQLQVALDEVRRLNTELEERVRQRTAELAAANRNLQTFASAVSHDLRTPLRAISSYTQILATTCRDKLDDRARTCLDNIQSQVQRMRQLIEALLQLSRATRVELRREPVNLSQLVREIAADFRHEQPSRKVGFTIASDLVAQADSVLLRSALHNLLANAWKFTAKAPAARIEFGQVVAEGKLAYFVSDNGAGFDMAEAPKLFVPFQRLHNPADFPGTGIGLATVQQIIRRHGGRVWARSTPGQGATFYFTLQ